VSAPDVEVAVFLAKKLVATALSSWTPPTADPDAFVAVAKRAGFDVVVYGAGKHPGPAVVREPAYSTSTGPLLRSIARAFAADVLTPVIQKWREKAPDDAFFANLADLVRAGSLEAPSSPKLSASPRFAVLLALVTLVALACTKSAAPVATTTTTKPAEAAAPQPKLDASAVLAILAQAAPSVAVSMRNDADGVALDLKGPGSSEVALAQLESLSVKLPDARVSSMGFEANAWNAQISTSPSSSLPLLEGVVASRAVIGPVLATGVVFATGTKLTFRGDLAPGKSAADAAVPPLGYTIARVDSGPPVVIELTRAEAFRR
jgi:hypothetical protein